MKCFVTVLLLFSVCFVFSQEEYPEGFFQEFYNNGKIKREGFYKKKKRVGVWKSFYKSGALHKVYAYKENGDFSFNEKVYSETGVLIRDMKPEDDGRLLCKIYYPDGNLHLVGYKSRVQQKKMIYEWSGESKEFYNTGVLKSEGVYSHNELQGVWVQYYPSGERSWEVSYVDGYKQGAYKHYYKNGALHVEGKHDLDVKSGTEKQFDSLGNELYRLKYKKGEFKSSSNSNNITVVNVPEGAIEKVPVFPGCENEVGNVEKKKCMGLAVTRFVESRFNTSFSRDLGVKGEQKIYLIFKIGEEGMVEDIKARAKHPALEHESIRVISLLPPMQPGTLLGEVVTVPYSLPIVFKIF